MTPTPESNREYGGASPPTAFGSPHQRTRRRSNSVPRLLSCLITGPADRSQIHGGSADSSRARRVSAFADLASDFTTAIYVSDPGPLLAKMAEVPVKDVSAYMDGTSLRLSWEQLSPSSECDAHYELASGGSNSEDYVGAPPLESPETGVAVGHHSVSIPVPEEVTAVKLDCVKYASCYLPCMK